MGRQRTGDEQQIREQQIGTGVSHSAFVAHKIILPYLIRHFRKTTVQICYHEFRLIRIRFRDSHSHIKLNTVLLKYIYYVQLESGTILPKKLVSFTGSGQ